MDLPAVIDIAIGLVILYLLLSTLGSFVVEMIATWRWWRPRLLYETIGRLITGAGHCPAPRAPWPLESGRALQSALQLLRKWLPPSKGPVSGLLTPADIVDTEELARQHRLTGEMLSAFWKHPLARNLAPEGRLPSYIEPTTFAAIVIDLALPGAAEGIAPNTPEGIERSLDLAVRSGQGWLVPLRARLLAIQRLRDVQGSSKSPPEPPLATLQTPADGPICSS